jgi:hypothetical protein
MVVTAEQSTEGSSSACSFRLGKLDIPTPIFDSMILCLFGNFKGVSWDYFVWTFIGEDENFCLAQANIDS